MKNCIFAAEKNMSMRKILFTVLMCCAVAFVGCSKNNDNDAIVADKENCVAKPIAFLLQSGDLTSIMQESDGSVKYQVQMFSADKDNIIICNKYVSNLRNQWAGSKESNDKLEYLNGYTVIICQCSDKIETAIKIYEQFNSGAKPIETNLK